MKNKKVLIVEDDLDMMEATKTVLESDGFEVLTAYTPDDGLQLLHSNPPNLVVLDAMFGKKEELKGFEFSIQIRKDPATASIPVLMVSSVNKEKPGFGFSDHDGEFLPVDGFINKPAQPSDLLQKATSLLNKGESRWRNWPDQAKSGNA